MQKTPEYEWDYYPGLDTEESFAVFTMYLSLRPRSIQDLAVLYPRRSVGTLRNWATNAFWDERAIAYDRFLFKIQCEARVTETKETAKELAEKHTELTRHMYTIAKRELLKHHRESHDSEYPVLKLDKLTTLVKEVISLQRLISGQPTEIIGDHLNTANLNQQDLDDLDRLLKKMAENSDGTTDPGSHIH